MKLTRCSNGHFYDGDKYKTCPHCAENGIPGAGEDETVTTPINPPRVPDAVTSSANQGFGNGETIPVNFNGFNVGGGGLGETLPVTGLGETAPVTQPIYGVGVGNSAGSNAVNNEDEGVTVSYWDPIIKTQGNTNTGAESSDEPGTPCVGWLICIEGMHLGHDYRLYLGRNTIGRTENNSVALRGDTSVSKEAQAIIAYEPQGNRFFAVPGTARSLSYVNGQVLLSQIELKKNDIIELGKTKLMLIPCCDDVFNWNMVLDKNS
jgi:hypothetical protein